MANSILVTGAAGSVCGVGSTVTELLLKRGKAVRATGQGPQTVQEFVRKSAATFTASAKAA
jgi:NADPH:quinone reductase-like Zn-dependent oxidoreductase